MQIMKIVNYIKIRNKLFEEQQTNQSIIMKINWFKIVVSVFLAGVLYLGWEYVQVQKEMAKNGRYISAPVFNGYYIIDTQTGNSYDVTGTLKYEYKLTNK